MILLAALVLRHGPSMMLELTESAGCPLVPGVMLSLLLSTGITGICLHTQFSRGESVHMCVLTSWYTYMNACVHVCGCRCQLFSVLTFYLISQNRCLTSMTSWSAHFRDPRAFPHWSYRHTHLCHTPFMCAGDRN